MPVYLCRVADGKGKIEEMLREAVSEEPLLREFSSRNLYIISMKELVPGEASAKKGRRFSRKVVGELTDLLTLMLGSGLSLKDSLEVAQSISTRGPGNELVTLLLERIRKGGTFAAALEGAGTSFPSVYRGMVKIGERIGSLDQVFTRLSTYLTDEKKLRDRLAGALMYPSIVLSMAVASAVLIVTVFFPRMREFFSQLGPETTGKVDSLMNTLTVAFAVIGSLLALLVGALVFVMVTRRKGGPRAVLIDAFFLRVPLLRTFLMQRELLNFTFAMETLTSSGVSVDEALLEAAETVSNNALREDVRSIREKVMKGEHLSAAFSRSAMFPPRISRWVGIGERVGHVEKVFGQLRLYYQQEVEKWINRIMSLIEPAIIVALGLMIVLFIVFFIIPIFSLIGNVM
jgi:type II secretory pathway component PulF